MKRLLIYSYIHCPEEKREQNLDNIKSLKETASNPEKIIVEILLNLSNLEYIETEYKIENLKTDFRLHFTNGMIRRCEVNGSHHFYGRESQGQLKYTESWINFICKQNDALIKKEPCLNINCLVKGSDDALGFQRDRWKKQLHTLSWLSESRKFRQALTKLTCTNINRNINVNIIDDVLYPIKFTSCKSVDDYIKYMINTPDYIIETL